MPFTLLSEGLSLFRATTAFCRSPLTSPATKMLKSCCFSGCNFLCVGLRILLFITLAQQLEQALSKCPKRSVQNWTFSGFVIEKVPRIARCAGKDLTHFQEFPRVCTALPSDWELLLCLITHSKGADSRQPRQPSAPCEEREREERAAPPWEYWELPIPVGVNPALLSVPTSHVTDQAALRSLWEFGFSNWPHLSLRYGWPKSATAAPVTWRSIIISYGF